MTSEERLDTRTPERKAKDDAIRTRVEAEGTTFSRLPKEKQAQLVAAARRKKQQKEHARNQDAELGKAMA